MLIACAFPLIDQTQTNPPDQGMEPKQRRHHHVQSGRQVVAAPDVRKLVQKDCLEFLAVEPVGQP
jgi:hypothetical protein